MLHSGMKHRIMSKGHGTQSVTIKRRLPKLYMQFLKEGVNSQDVCCDLCQTLILCLGTAACHYCLFLRPLGDGVWSKKHTGAEGWTPIIKTLPSQHHKEHKAETWKGKKVAGFRRRPQCIVPWRYRRILFTAVQRVSSGLLIHWQTLLTEKLNSGLKIVEVLKCTQNGSIKLWVMKGRSSGLWELWRSNRNRVVDGTLWLQAVPCTLPICSAICILLDAENPCTANGFPISRQRNQCPGSISFEEHHTLHP